MIALDSAISNIELKCKHLIAAVPVTVTREGRPCHFSGSISSRSVHINLNNWYIGIFTNAQETLLIVQHFIGLLYLT